MTEIKFETKVTDAVAGEMPQLRPFVGRRVELTAHPAVAPTEKRSTITFQEFLERHRLEKPDDRPTVTLEEMETVTSREASGEDL